MVLAMLRLACGYIGRGHMSAFFFAATNRCWLQSDADFCRVLHNYDRICEFQIVQHVELTLPSQG